MKILFILFFAALVYANESLALNKAIDLLKVNNLEIKNANLDLKSAKKIRI